MSRILLTGATGYLGSHLAHVFLARGHDVAILKRSTSNMKRLADIVSRLNIFNLDVDDVHAPFEALGSFDAVVHTATCYGRNSEKPLEIFMTNSQFPLELLETAIFFKSGCFINTDTALDDNLNAYALSKRQFSQWGKHYANSGAVRFINVRLEHFYGPDDDPSKFTTWIIRQCLDRVASIPLTGGEQKRDFIYIDDVVSAYLLLLKRASGVKEWLEVGLGSGQSITVKNFVDTVHKITNSTSKLDFGAIPYRKGEIMESEPDLSFMNNLGWEATWDLYTGLMATVKGEINK